MNGKINYEIMILLNDEFNDNQLKTWAFNFAKELQRLNIIDISVISRGKRNLAYQIKDKKKSNFIQINFFSLPKNLATFSTKLKLDTNVLRFLILNKTV